MLIRYAQLNDKTEWFRLDRHLPEAGFEEKNRNKQVNHEKYADNSCLSAYFLIIYMQIMEALYAYI